MFMENNHILAFLLIYLSIASFTCLILAFRKAKITAFILVLIALVALTATSVLGAMINPEQNYLQFLLSEILAKNPRMVAALGLGLMTGALWLSFLFSQKAQRTITQILLAISLLGTTGAALAFVVKDHFRNQLKAKMIENGFEMEEIATFSGLPIRVAVDENDNAYVSLDAYDSGDQFGTIEKVSLQDNGKYKKETVAHSSALFRPYGLAARDGKLYVSRSGNIIRAQGGGFVYEDAGAVTELRDLNEDGFFEYYHDIVQLPGTRGPGTQHQNNGIVFSEDGALYITNALSSDEAIAEHPLEGALLRASPDFKRVEIVATGLRNPFGIAIGLGGEVFVTDNDITRGDPGDELNHIIPGEHYGHPYAFGKETSHNKNFMAPLHVSPKQSNLLGLASLDHPSFSDELRRSLLMVNVSHDSIYRLQLVKDGKTFRVEKMTTFAKINRPLDVAVSPKGTIFMVSRFGQRLYRVTKSK